jgi:hypothetical protein
MAAFAVEDVRAVTWKAEDVPGRLHWYEVRLVTSSGRRFRVQSIDQPSFVHRLLSGGIPIAPGIVSACAEKALTFWNEDEGNFRTPLPRALP